MLKMSTAQGDLDQNTHTTAYYVLPDEQAHKIPHALRFRRDFDITVHPVFQTFGYGSCHYQKGPFKVLADLKFRAPATHLRVDKGPTEPTVILAPVVEEQGAAPL